MCLTVPVRTSSRHAFILRALRYRNYRLFFTGQIVSLVGTWMTMTATSWLVYRLTGSAMALGAVGFAVQFPAFLLSPFAGIFVDRWNRHRLLVATQTVSMLQSLALAALTLTGQVTVLHVVLLNVVQGLVNAFDMPARQAFLVTIVDKREDLGNAIALNSSMVNVSRLIGPAVAGFVIAATNEGWCFLIDGFSYLAVIAALLAMRIAADPAAARPRGGAVLQFREGVSYAFGSRPIRSLILLFALVGLAGVPYGVLMPVFAAEEFGGGPHTLGFLMTASGGGALIGAVWLAARTSVLGLGRLIPATTALFGAGLIVFALSPTLWIAVPSLVVAGLGFMVQMASSNTLLQTIVDDDKRGRVMSFYLMAFLGSVPVGSLLAGWLATRIGAPSTLFIGGACCIAGAAWFANGLPAMRAAIRPIYIRMGIVEEVVTGLGTSSDVSVPPEQP